MDKVTKDSPIISISINEATILMDCISGEQKLLAHYADQSKLPADNSMIQLMHRQSAHLGNLSLELSHRVEIASMFVTQEPETPESLYNMGNPN